jgi:putative glutamine amidotransferase
MHPTIALIFRNEHRVQPYTTALLSVGLQPVRILVSDRVNLGEYHGLVLMGGTDIDPDLYGQELGVSTQSPDCARDEFESTLADQALRLQMPVLAICRGMQLINVLRGGSLTQDLPTKAVHYCPCPGENTGHHRSAHRIQVLPNTLLRSIVNNGQLDVNSRHHQGIERLGKGLVATALADDNVVEAIELQDHSTFLGVQWHPEDRILVSEFDKALFDWFASTVRHYRF